MKTRNMLLILALGACIAMAFTFEPSKTLPNDSTLSVMNTPSTVVEEFPALGTEIHITHTDGTQSIVILTQEIKDKLNGKFKDKPADIKGSSFSATCQNMCLDNVWMWCCITPIGWRCQESTWPCGTSCGGC